MNEHDLIDYITNRSYLCVFCGGLKEKVKKEGLQAIDNYQGMICGGVEDMKIRRFMQKQAEKRPDNYESLSAREQWEIDKELGILDWDGKDGEEDGDR